MHYNYHRYYDPSLGRYITSDPIGLEGGLNTYSYVENNPLNWVDPYGLIRWSGSYKSKGGSLGIGGTIIEYELTSECINGKRAVIKVRLTGGTIGKGWGITDSRGPIAFEDHKDKIDPDIFNGSGGSVGGSIVIGKGGGVSKTRLGDAFSRPANGETKGLEVGVGISQGYSRRVGPVRWEDCDPSSCLTGI
ncbi:MAG: RHS repeat-associated core domain-containing protein [Gammaproteobacteria bacterium]|nr:RHS repeat-associated core domain-containing protein [Gammaproteobacteria bacterium]